MKKLTFATTFLAFFALFSTPVFSEETSYNALEKFGRGVGNVSLGLWEIPKQVMRENEESNMFYAMTTGLGVGFSRAILRTVVGVYEVGTFILPFPANYAPIMKPEYVFQDVTDGEEMELEE